MSYYHDPLVDDAYDPDTAIEVDFAYILTTVVHGDITALFTWNFAKDNGDPEPLLALAPTFAPPQGQAPRLCCIVMSDGWKWSRSHNDDDQVVFEEADEYRLGGDQWQREVAQYFAAVLGLASHDPSTVRRIRGIIEDNLQFLATMPRAPVREAAFQEAARHGMEVEIIDHATGKTHTAPLRMQ